MRIETQMPLFSTGWLREFKRVYTRSFACVNVELGARLNLRYIGMPLSPIHGFGAHRFTLPLE